MDIQDILKSVAFGVETIKQSNWDGKTIQTFNLNTMLRCLWEAVDGYKDPTAKIQLEKFCEDLAFRGGGWWNK